MASYYDALNYTYKLFEEREIPGGAQLVMLHLLQENNRHANTGYVQISDRELGHRTRLSKDTITESKRKLKNNGFIRFKTQKGKPTVYELPIFTAGQTAGQAAIHKAGQSTGQSTRFKVVPFPEVVEEKTKSQDARASSTAAARSEPQAEKAISVSNSWIREKLAAIRKEQQQ